VRIPEYSETVNVDRFKGDLGPGDRIRVRYDSDDPTVMVQEGVSVWGPFEFVIALMAVAGIVSVVIEIRRWTRRPRRGRPIHPLSPRSGDGSTDPNRAQPWAAKRSRKRRRR
jgi:hypothetical protein